MSKSRVRDSTLRKIEKAIDEIHAEDPTVFKLNLSELARRSHVSRPTLAAAREKIQSYIDNLPSIHSVISEEHVVSTIEYCRLQKQCSKLKKQNQILLSQFSDLFFRIYGESVDMRQLIVDDQEDS